MSTTAVSRALTDEALETVLDVRDLRIDRSRQDRRDRIVSEINLSLRPGETVGIVGESGSGKSMTARAIIGLLPPGLAAAGVVMYGGRNLLDQRERQWRKIRGREIGMIMQDPFTMLNPVMRCGDIIEESLRADTISRNRAERRAEVIRRLREVRIVDEHVVDRYPFQLSGGMRQRVAIAAALAREPKVLIADEPSTALDITTQRETLALIKSLQEARSMSLILITHDLRVGFAMCDRIYVLYAGSLVEVGPSDELEMEPLHPYTHGLLLSEPPADRRIKQLISIPGSVPAPDDVAGSCTFAPRCGWALPICSAGSPPLLEIVSGHHSACVRIEEIRSELSALRETAIEDGPAPPADRASTALVEVDDVHKVFNVGRRSVVALESVSLRIGEQESVGLVGESGSGKSTLARILVGLEHASKGKVSIDGIDASHWGSLSGRDRRALRRTVQIVFQDPYSSLNPMRTVGSTLSEAITTHDPRTKNVSARVTDLLTSVGLPSIHAQRKPAALSGGERQRVAIARALAVDPRILICDEPVSALDMSVQAQILNLLVTLRAERSIAYLFISHDLSIVRQVTEYVYVMYRGQVVESGPVEDVLTNPKDTYTIKLLESVPRTDAAWLTTAQ